MIAYLSSSSQCYLYCIGNVNNSESMNIEEELTTDEFKHPTSNKYIEFEEQPSIEKKVDRIWHGRSVLKVYFMNPEKLVEWKCETSIGTIMSWASTWTSPHYPQIPRFEETEDTKKADIRVKFSGDLLCLGAHAQARYTVVCLCVCVCVCVSV